MNIESIPPTVSVIICTYTFKRLNDTKEAVGSVLSQNLKPYEIIISVDHNEELYQELVGTYGDLVENPGASLKNDKSQHQPPPLKLIHNTGIQGLSESRNAGIRASSGDIITFSDDDAIAEQDWLEKLVAPFVDSYVVAVGGRAIPLWLNGKRPIWFPEELDWIIGCDYKGLPLKGNEIRNVHGCNMAFRKKCFELIGGFATSMGGINETPRGGEEAHLCLRIKYEMADSLIIYEPGAIIHHKVHAWRLNLKYLIRRSFNEGFYKRVVKKISPKSSQQKQVLSTENSYLRFLILKSIPRRLVQFYKIGNILQIGSIIISMAATSTGYIVEELDLKRNR
jgi:cellulose synthase/poly-beta-1,6-N-acetylglucosamine synthase-like glycosyltransferase